MSSKKNSGFKSTLFSIIWSFICIGFIVAAYNVSGGNLSDLYPKLLGKSNSLRSKIVACYNNNWKCPNNERLFDFSSSGNISNSQSEQANNSSSNQSSINTNSDNSDNSNNSTDNQSSNTIKDNSQLPSETSSKSNIKSLQSLKITSAAKDDVIKELNSLNVVSAYDTVKYKRTEWKHWTNLEGSSCWTTREEALYQQSEPSALVLLDKNKKVTHNIKEACSIQKGKWVDPYSNEVITDPIKTDVDHTSPLAATARAGGQSWSAEQKQNFANDLDHLVVTSQKENRTKGDKTPSKWLPDNKKSHCDYAKIYVNILYKYNLNVTQEDKDVLNKLLNACEF